MGADNLTGRVENNKTEYAKDLGTPVHGYRETGLEIAVIGMSGRFPGADDIETFWENLKSGVESIHFFTDRELWDAGIDPAELEHPEYVKAKGILNDIESFDAVFFGLSPHEVAVMDPQVRIFHECAWTALENAGYDPASFSGLVGLYAGAAANLGWEALAVLSGRARILGDFHSWHLFDKDFLSTRVAYNLNLRGPAVNVQTACSTALVAVHIACQALLSGECDIAMAGGVSVRMPSREGYIYREGLIMSPDGHCRAFDAGSGGTVLGEGCGIVVLKQLGYAREDGDYIYAVIKGSAINNDGHGRAGYTSPSVNGQIEVIRAAFQAADVEPGSISYIEAHGTGTRLGDTTEIEALTRVFNSNKKNSCAIGSVKTNIGHLDCAAGAAGLIKTVLALKNKLIPASLHFHSPNPGIDFDAGPFYVNRRLSSWPRKPGPLRAGLSSFGIGGTNAHVILEEAPVEDSGNGETGAREWQLLPVSARTAAALETATGNLADHVRNYRDEELADVAYTLQTGRKAFQHRRVFLCSSLKDAVDIFNPDSPLSLYTSFCPEPHHPLVFMFPGQGTQYTDMGKQLYRYEAVFREKVDRCFDILESLSGLKARKLKEILYPPVGEVRPRGDEERIMQTGWAQPLLFVFEYALARTLIAWGIKPDSLMGHSLGEFTAACIAGVFSLEDSLTLVAERGRLMQELPPGIMLGVQLSPDRIVPYLDEGVSLSAINTPFHCVISGPPERMKQVEQQLNRSRVSVRQLYTSHAFHSHMMEPIVHRFAEAVGRISVEEPKIPFISSVTGTWIRETEVRNPMYWATQMKRPVQLAAGIGGLLMESNGLLVEVGPGRTLCSFVRQNPHFMPRHALVDLVRHPGVRVDDCKYLIHQLGQLWLHGVNPDWEAYTVGQRRRRLPLPTYPFERQRFPIQGVQDLTRLRSVNGRELSAVGCVSKITYSCGNSRISLAGTTNGSSLQADAKAQAVNRPARQRQSCLEKKGGEHFNFAGPGCLAPESEFEPSPSVYRKSYTSKPLPTAGPVSDNRHTPFGGTCEANPRPFLTSVYRPPANRLQRRLVHIWEDFLGVRPVGLDDDFFQLGGDSLKAVGFVNRIHVELDYPISLAVIFNCPTVRTQAQHIEESWRWSRYALDWTEEKEYYPLSPAQQRIYLQHCLDENGLSYNMPHTAVLEGTLDLQKFSSVFQRLVDRHESLRTSFLTINGCPVQRIHKHLDVQPVVRKVGGTEPMALLRKFIRPFDLTVPPLIRLVLLEDNRSRFILLLDAHHIIADGTSIGILIREFGQLYGNGEEEHVKIDADREPRFQYKEFCQWYFRRFHENGSEWETRKRFWKDELSGEITCLQLPSDFPRPGVQVFTGKFIKFEIYEKQTRLLNTLSVETGATLYMVLLAIFNILLAKLSGQEDILIGSAASGRNHAGLENIVGMFVNTIVLRNNPNGGMNFRRFLEDVRERLLDALENQDYPLDRLVQDILPDRDPTRHPFFNVMFYMRPLSYDRFDLPGLTVTPFPYDRGVSKFDLSLEAATKGHDRLLFWLHYNIRIFKTETAEWMISQFLQIMEIVLEEPYIRLKDINLSSQVDKDQLLTMSPDHLENEP